MQMEDVFKTLEQFALDHYEEGGHWVYETHDKDDYQMVLDDAFGDIEKAKDILREYWGFMNDRKKDCSFE